jgi:RES domain-containing protein
MILWRISRHLDLSGRGGILDAGRWHHAGRPVVYLAESPAGALLETCVHTSASDIPPSFKLLKVVGSGASAGKIRLADLESGCTDRTAVTRDLGSAWLKGAATALLRVPSALVPETWNYLLNPVHADAPRFQIEESFRFPFDTRLKSGRAGVSLPAFLPPAH